ncbi:MAG TPA: hypothetical protein VM433_12740 [Mycobacteriales bacterium]|nr:hypothetical protein [Mycobacteriales bacterium]
MAVATGVLSGVADDPALRAVEDRIAARETDRHALHALQLQDVLLLEQAYRDAGEELCLPAALALQLRCSEAAAEGWLEEARFWAGLPFAFASMQSGVLTISVARMARELLEPLPVEVRARVWAQLRRRLEADLEQGIVRPRPRAREWLKNRIAALAPGHTTQEREQAEAGRGVTFSKREDAVTDITAFGIPGLAAQAVLARLNAVAVPWGPADHRTLHQRRADAFVDLLLGRPLAAPLLGCDGTLSDGTQLLPDGTRADTDGRPVPTCPGGSRTGCGCGCGIGAGVPCGADVQVLVPFGAALGTTDEVAEATGNAAGGGPLDPELLERLLASAPRVTPVFVGADGVPVAVGQPFPVARGDVAGLRQRLQSLARKGPAADRLVPRHPDDHPPPKDEPPDGEGLRPPDTGRPRPATHQADVVAPGRPPPRPVLRRTPLPYEHQVLLGLATLGVSTPLPTGRQGADTQEPSVLGAPTRSSPSDGADLGHPHPAGQPGAYRVPPRLRRLLQVRAPRCEWPGCGARASRCDLDHDLHWPDGPTCGCNLGPLCRRHHRVKQRGWTKTRRADGSVAWTGPTGQHAVSPAQHEPPATPAPPAVTTSTDDLDPGAWMADPAHPWWDELAAYAVSRPMPVDPQTLPPVDRVRAGLLADGEHWHWELRDTDSWDTDLLRAIAEQAPTRRSMPRRRHRRLST